MQVIRGLVDILDHEVTPSQYILQYLTKTSRDEMMNCMATSVYTREEQQKEVWNNQEKIQTRRKPLPKIFSEVSLKEDTEGITNLDNNIESRRNGSKNNVFADRLSMDRRSRSHGKQESNENSGNVLWNIKSNSQIADRPRAPLKDKESYKEEKNQPRKSSARETSLQKYKNGRRSEEKMSNSSRRVSSRHLNHSSSRRVMGVEIRNQVEEDQRVKVLNNSNYLWSVPKPYQDNRPNAADRIKKKSNGSTLLGQSLIDSVEPIKHTMHSVEKSSERKKQVSEEHPVVNKTLHSLPKSEHNVVFQAQPRTFAPIYDPQPYQNSNTTHIPSQRVYYRTFIPSQQSPQIQPRYQQYSTGSTITYRNQTPQLHEPIIIRSESRGGEIRRPSIEKKLPKASDIRTQGQSSYYNQPNQTISYVTEINRGDIRPSINQFSGPVYQRYY